MVVVVACAPSTRSETLSPGDEIVRTIREGEVHRFVVSLARDQVAAVTVDQRGADIAVTTFDPSGKSRGSVDGPGGWDGAETIAIEAHDAGGYAIEVAPTPAPGAPRFRVGSSGEYAIRVDVTSAAEFRDRAAKRVAAFWDGDRVAVDELVAWLGREGHAVAVDESDDDSDLAAVDAIVGHAHVIGFGEADHDIHEYLALRNRIFEHLVMHGDVIAYVGETGGPEAIAVDDYVTGGSGDARALGGRAFSWGIETALPENVALLEWLRAYNQHAARPVHFYGMDLAGGRGGVFTASRLALDTAMDYLRVAVPATAARLGPQLAPFTDTFDAVGDHRLNDAQHAARADAIAELVATFERERVAMIAGSSQLAYERAQRVAINAAQLDGYFRSTRGQSSIDAPADPTQGGARDAAMASNLAWVVDHERGGRVFVFAHTAHLRRGPTRWMPTKILPPASAGQHAAALFGDDYVVIGSLHGGGDDDTFDALVGRAKLPVVLFDLRHAPSSAHRPWHIREEWLAEYHLAPYWIFDPVECFDAMIYIDKTTPAVPPRR